MNISAVIICRDEEAALERCLQSVRFCDEVVVVDSGSRDGTVSIAQRYADKVESRPWSGYGAQKNFANELARNDWILSIDADEEVDATLREALEEAVRGTGDTVAYSVPRKTFQFGRWIQHGGWYPDRQIRLFRKSRGRWTEGAVHESWEPDGACASLSPPLLHHSFDGLSDQLHRYERYAFLQASELVNAGVRPSAIRMVSRPLRKFLEVYFWKRGFLDGAAGVVIGMAMAYAAFVKQARIWELTSVRKQSPSSSGVGPPKANSSSLEIQR